MNGISATKYCHSNHNRLRALFFRFFFSTRSTGEIDRDRRKQRKQRKNWPRQKTPNYKRIPSCTSSFSRTLPRKDSLPPPPQPLGLRCCACRHCCLDALVVRPVPAPILFKRPVCVYPGRPPVPEPNTNTKRQAVQTKGLLRALFLFLKATYIWQIATFLGGDFFMAFLCVSRHGELKKH
jgi:hypothetical protein